MKPFLKVFLSILLFIVFTACNDNKDSFAYYEISGTVTDNISTQPVYNIRVIRAGTEYLYINDTTYTDSLGKYDFGFIDYYNKSASFIIKVEDIDNALNGGSYLSQVSTVKFSKSDWLSSVSTSEYDGSAVKVFNISLTK
jgi:putative lipoprotein (rSAM/lipoprotein system)